MFEKLPNFIIISLSLIIAAVTALWTCFILGISHAGFWDLRIYGRSLRPKLGHTERYISTTVWVALKQHVHTCPRLEIQRYAMPLFLQDNYSFASNIVSSSSNVQKIFTAMDYEKKDVKMMHLIHIFLFILGYSECIIRIKLGYSIWHTKQSLKKIASELFSTGCKVPAGKLDLPLRSMSPLSAICEHSKCIENSI